MYEIIKSPIGRFEAYQLIHQETGSYLEILSGLGAAINDLKVKNSKDQLVSVVAGYRSDDEIRNGHHSKFAGSKLSPFPNRLAAGKFTFEGTEHQLYINEIELNNNLHALLHNRPFDVVSSSADDKSAVLVLKHAYQGVEKGFPFPYDIEISVAYTLQETTISTKVTNTGDTNMPIGDGWHPYFIFEDISKVSLKMGQATRVSSLVGNEEGNVHGYESGRLIGEGQLDDCFLVQGDRFEVGLEDAEAGVSITTWQESATGQYRYLQVYTPPNRKEIAVEPVSCPPNAFNTGKGLVVLAPGESTEMKIGIRVG